MKKLILFFLILMDAGCSTVQYQIGFPPDADRSSFTRYEVKEIQFVTSQVNHAEFGPYRVTLVRYGLTNNEKIDDGFYTDKETHTAAEKYSYELRGLGKQVWTGECDSSAEYYCKESGIFFTTTDDGYYKNTFQCRFTSQGQQPLEIKIEVNETYKSTEIPGYKKGYAKSGNVQLDLERTMKTEKMSLAPMHIGYYIYNRGELVAVVQNMIHGNVYIHSKLDPKLLPLVVNTCAALLTYYDLEQEVLADDEEEED